VLESLLGKPRGNYYSLAVIVDVKYGSAVRELSAEENLALA